MKKIILLLITLFTITLSVKAQTVHITKTGKKYHAENCQYLKNSNIAISLQDAINKGYTPCSVCNPPTNNSSPEQQITIKPSPTKNNNTESTGVRTGCICRDGTESSATGRGACSHHGGVDHWLYK